MPAANCADAPSETASLEKHDLNPIRMPYRSFIPHRVAKTHHGEGVCREDVDKRQPSQCFARVRRWYTEGMSPSIAHELIERVHASGKHMLLSITGGGSRAI
ncbi:MAG TPA: hypothetical protein VGK58_00380, partial [Lacipirellulaceae bacterium]